MKEILTLLLALNMSNIEDYYINNNDTILLNIKQNIDNNNLKRYLCKDTTKLNNVKINKTLTFITLKYDSTTTQKE